jgi:hypothetical protein
MSESTELPQYWITGSFDTHIWVYRHPNAERRGILHLPYVAKTTRGFAAYPGGKNPPSWVHLQVMQESSAIPVLPTLEAAMVAVTVMFNAGVSIEGE